ncbi:MAG: DUF389 domain-containing protein [Wujia sp.]
MKTKVKDIISDIFSIHGDSADHDEIRERIISGGEIRGTNMCVLVLAILIASIGLNMNSTAVIIGAMLVSPLMGSILAIAYGSATLDIALVKKSIIGFVFQIVFSVTASAVYFKLTPIKTATSELIARTQPTIWDVCIAICGGLAGIIGMTRKEKSNVIPGVAIATALMPPLCTCGYAIANGRLGMLLGAGYLFTVNSYFIFITAMIVLLVLEAPKVGIVSEKTRKKMVHKLIRNTLFMIIPSLIVAFFVTKESNNVTAVYDSRIENESVIAQIDILFPEIDSVKVGSVEAIQEDGEFEYEHVIIVCSQDMLSEERETQLLEWLKEIYKEDYKLMYDLQ